MPIETTAYTALVDAPGEPSSAALQALFPGDGVMARRARDCDWSRTPLGAHERWPAALRAACAIALNARLPMLLLAGPERTLLYNDACRPWLGAERLGLAAPQALPFWERVAASADAALASGEAWTTPEVALQRADGDEDCLCFWFSPVAGGAALGVGVEQRRADEALRASEATQRFLVALNAELQRLADPDAIAAATARLVCEHLGAERCAYAEVEPDEDHFIIGRDYTAPGVPSVTGRWRIAEFGAAARALLRENAPFALGEAAHDPRLDAAERAAYRAIGVEAVIAMPLQREGRLVAGIVVNQGRPREWRAQEIELVRAATLQCFEASARARALRDLAASEARFRRLADAMPHLVFAAAPDGAVTWVNRYAREFTGVEGELHGSRRYGLVHPADRERMRAAWTRALASGETYEIEVRMRRADGAYRWLLSRALPVHDDAGRIVEWVGASVDIDELRAVQHALQEADRRKDEFLATLAHELRNPLAPLRNAAHLLQLAPSAETAERVSALMQRQIGQLVRLVDDLLEVSRISGGKIELKRQPVSLADVLASAIETSRPAIDAQRHHLRVDIAPAPLVLDADALRLAQVFANLLNNAAKYTDPGGEIELRARREDDEAVVMVCDNGIGIAPEMLPRVFELFTQIDRSAARAQGGLGIGLSLVKSLVALHGGQVEAFSKGLGRGSRFVVRLPLLQQARACIAAAAAAPGPARPLRRVLVVDDNRDAADTLATLLGYLGASVSVAHSGSQALAALDSERPSVVLLDLGMPGMDGYEVARRMRARPDGASLTLIALTGWGQAAERARSREAGFDHHLVKPADIELLQALLEGRGAAS